MEVGHAARRSSGNSSPPPGRAKGPGVESLAVFGSTARNEATPDSDVALLVEFNRPAGLFGLLDIQYRLEEILGVKVDLVSRSGVHPSLRDNIFAEAVNAI